jgi:hypothetical protein
VTRRVCEKIAQNVAQPIFVATNAQPSAWNFFFALSEIFKTLPKVNNHDTGENSTNLVTLFDT